MRQMQQQYEAQKKERAQGNTDERGRSESREEEHGEKHDHSQGEEDEGGPDEAEEQAKPLVGEAPKGKRRKVA